MAKKAQRQGILIDSNQGIVITGEVGGNVMLTNGKEVPVLELRIPWHEPRESIESLLKWNSKLTSVIGRSDELARLTEWVNSKPLILARVLYGPGGTGKTRLAAELATQLRESDWAAGYIDPDKPPAFLLGEAGTLLLVDYPEERITSVMNLLKKLAMMEPSEKPIRLLLLSRHGDNWRDYFHQAHVEDIMDQPFGLAPLMKGDCWHLFNVACNKAREVIGSEVADYPINESEFYAWLDKDPLHRRPLITLAYAVQLAYEPNFRELCGTPIIEALVRRETGRWRNEATAAGMQENTLLQLRALAAVTEGLDGEQIRLLANNKGLALDLPSAREIVDRISRTGHWVGHLSAPEPDLLAAHILHDVLALDRSRAGQVLRFSLEISEDELDALKRLGRLAYDMRDTLRLEWFGDEFANAISGDAEICGRLSPFFSESKAIDRGLLSAAIVVFSTLADAAQDESIQASNLCNLSIFLAEIGDRDGGLQAAQQAVGIYKQLEANNQGAQKHELARSLDTLAARYFEIGNHVVGLDTMRQSTDIYEDLAYNDSDKYLPDLAQSLSNLSYAQAESGGDLVGGLDTGLKSVYIYRRLEKLNPGVYDFKLATVLSNLSTRLRENSKPDEALKAIKEAKEIFDKLAQANPASYEQFLAHCLENLSILLFENNELKAGSKAIQQALEILERLVKDQPDAFEPNLGKCLREISNQLAEREDWGDAHAAIKGPLINNIVT